MKYLFRKLAFILFCLTEINWDCCSTTLPYIFTLTKKVPSYLFAHFGRFCKCRVQKSTINSSIVVYN